MIIETKIVIASDIESVWKKLLAFENYSTWNSFIPKIEGEKKIGASLIVDIAPPEGKKTTFKPIITKLEPNKELRWVGILGSKYLFQGEHYFILNAISDKKTMLIHGEVFTGLLLILFLFFGAKKTESGFQLMNNNLKQILEKRVE